MLTLDANVWVAAFDPRDAHHRESATFFEMISRQKLALHGPAIVVLEVTCALARRLRRVGPADEAARWLRAYPALQLHPIDEGLLDQALTLGSERGLRGMDALYAATAVLMDASLISWDSELIQRAGALSPIDWIASQTDSDGGRSDKGKS
ncbi:MAG TPA: type II toxin-antitoxin system VapC family toxin [Thermoflexales bacterium]|nr:type II toxin-antitoxin system VapC family toxin [Thermoflexales bacterium]